MILDSQNNGTTLIIRSKRRTIAIEIKQNHRIVVRASLGMKNKDILRFVDEKQYRWLKENRSKIIGRLEV